MGVMQVAESSNIDVVPLRPSGHFSQSQVGENLSLCIISLLSSSLCTIHFFAHKIFSLLHKDFLNNEFFFLSLSVVHKIKNSMTFFSEQLLARI